MATYREFHRHSIERPAEFWRNEARLIDWHKPFMDVLDYSRPPFARWFVGGETNLCHNAVYRHLKDRADQPALIFISTETGHQQTYTFAELHREINRCAAIFQAQGVAKGDRILIYMPMIPEAVFAMLACVRVGAIHSVVFGGFASQSLASRIDDAKPKRSRDPRHQPRDRAQDRAFTGRIGADDADEFALQDGEINAVEYIHMTVAGAQPLDFKQRKHGVHARLSIDRPR